MRIERSLWVGLACWAAQTSALANPLQLAESPALRCLTPAAADRGKPDYPEEEDRLKHGQVVEVELKFAGPHAAPEVRRVGEYRADRGDAFFLSVQRHVRKLRVPCMQPGEPPVTLRQIYSFSPSGRAIHAGAPSDSDDRERRRQVACVTRERPQETPSYPRDAQRNDEQGRILLLLRFDSADGPPQVRSFQKSSDLRRLIRHATDWAQGYRMPCYAGQPVEAAWNFMYRLGEDRLPVFKDTQLVTFLGTVKGIQQQRLDFDFRPMGCPFSVQIQYFQPHLPNRVQQLDNARIERQPFLDWLTRAELNLPPQFSNSMLGDNFIVDVPCARLDLQPSSPSPKKE